MKKKTAKKKNLEMILVSLRLPTEVAERAQALVEYLDRMPLTAAMVVKGASRSTVLRLALLRGLDLLELEAKEKGKGKRKSR